MLITTIDQLKAMVADYLTVDEFVFDVETLPDFGGGDFRVDPRRNRVAWISFATAGRADVLPLGHPNGDYVRTDYPLLPSAQKRIDAGLPLRAQDYSKDARKATKVFTAPPPHLSWNLEVREILRPLFFSDQVKVGHNIKFDIESLSKYFGETIPGPYVCTKIVSWLLDVRNKNFFDLASCCRREVEYVMVKGVGKRIEDHSFREVANYSWLDSRYTWLLWKELEQQVLERGIENLLHLEMDVLEVVVDMESTGAPIDVNHLTYLDTRLRGELSDVETHIYREAGRPFNINSTQEKATLLFTPKKAGGRGLRGGTLTEGGKKKRESGTSVGPTDFSTADDALEKFKGKDALVDLLVEYSDLKKLHSSFVVAYMGGEVIKTTGGKSKTEMRDSLLINERIHGTFKQDGTETGRFSSVEPNLQQVPSRSERGKEIRKLFRAPDGFVLVQADYSQIEPRIIADLSQDPAMVRAYMDGQDIYEALAEPFGLPRAGGKVLVLSIAYGTGPDKLANTVNISLDEAKKIIYKDFPRKFKGLDTHRRIVIAQARNRTIPHTKTMLGRMRYLPDLKSHDEYRRSRAERQAYNALIQGCLPADTRLLTDSGWVQIGDFVDGSKVWTGERWATATRRSMGPARRLRLWLSDGRSFDCDERHRLLVSDGPWPRWADMNEIIGLPLVRDTATDWGHNPGDDPEDWYWLGRMIGDGHTSRPGAKQKTWGLAFGPTESKDRAQFTRWLDKNRHQFLGGTGSKRGYCDSALSLQVIGGTRIGWSYWVDRGVVGGARGKRIPASVFTLDRVRREQFLRGYFDADGHEGNRSWKITSVNRPLLEDTLRLMQTLDMSGSISQQMFNSRGIGWYDLYLSTAKQPPQLTVTHIDDLPEEPMYTLSVDDERHAYSTEGLISKNTAADINKVGLIRAHHTLPPGGHLILTVHDEVVALIPEQYAEEAAVGIREALEGVDLLKTIPLLAETKIVKTWAEAKD